MKILLYCCIALGALSCGDAGFVIAVCMIGALLDILDTVWIGRKDKPEPKL